MWSLLLALSPAPDLSDLPERPRELASVDWLVEAPPSSAGVFRDGDRLVLDNGLVRREWRLEPGLGCVSFEDLTTGRQLLRAVRPEAIVSVDGEEWAVGGLIGQRNHAFLREDEELSVDPAAMTFVGFEVTEPVERLAWKRVRHHSPFAQWPPVGAGLRFDFEKEGVRVSVHYELYDHVPLVAKWFTLTAPEDRSVTIDSFQSEVLAVVEHDSRVEYREGIPIPHPDWMHVETDYAFGAMTPITACRKSVHWKADPKFTSQVNYLKLTPCLLSVGPEVGPDQDVAAGATFRSLTTFELVEDGADRTRRSLASARMYEVIAPWVTENPLMMHVRNSDDASVRRAIEQCAETGFEMLILTFGSGFNLEDRSEENRARWQALREEAANRGIELGGYSLLASRRIQPDTDNCINLETGKPGGQTFGYAPALASDWGQSYMRNLYEFYGETGFRLLEHDGSYPGDLDAAARPPLQKSYENSRWTQWRIITDFYSWCRSEGVFLNIPDWYYLMGANKCGMGYREVNWSLPRADQVLHTRQNIFDGTRFKRPSMGWMFVPLTQYHGGGAAATVEPLDEHLDHYLAMLDGNLGAGVQACYRGPRLYDTERVRDAVKGRVDWFKANRTILEAPIVHSASRRADGRELDWYLHAEPRGEVRGMLCIFNPTDVARAETLQVDLYYTGAKAEVTLEAPGQSPLTLPLDRRGRAQIEVEVPASGMTWLRIR